MVGATADHNDSQQNGERRVPASSSSPASSMSPRPDMTSHIPSGESSSGGVMTAREYAKSVECWLWQQQCWMQQVNWATWMQYSMPYFAVAATVETPTSVSTAMNRETRQENVPPQFHQTINQQQHQTGRDYRMSSINKRLMAEFIDFMLVFTVKLLVSLIAFDYGFNLFLGATDAEFDNLFTMSWDPTVALAISTELMVMEVVNRIFICIFETFCLWKIGATPGKRMMGICVVSCEDLIMLPGNRLRVRPAGNVSFLNALLRAAVKNFSVAFFFPVCLTVFFFPHNRTMYDMVSGSIVVDQPDDVLHAARRRR